jgi:DNA-binding MarR family transcriptional regulator
MAVSRPPVPSLRFDPIEEAQNRWLARWPQADRMAAATAIIRVQQIVMAAVTRALAPFGLTFARYEALVLLAFSRQGRLPLGKMGARLQVHPTSVTNAIDRLERQGLVRRTAAPDDRRATLAEITPEGRAVVEGATTAVLETHFGLAMLEESELRRLSEILFRVREASGDFSPADTRA